MGIGGVLIVEVLRGGSAAKAGIRSTRRESSGRIILGDVITAINGKKVGTFSHSGESRGR